MYVVHGYSKSFPKIWFKKNCYISLCLQYRSILNRNPVLWSPDLVCLYLNQHDSCWTPWAPWAWFWVLGTLSLCTELTMMQSRRVDFNVSQRNLPLKHHFNCVWVDCIDRMHTAAEIKIKGVYWIHHTSRYNCFTHHQYKIILALI